MRNLTTLHATGNALKGKLVKHLPLLSVVSDLSLSHNQLSGSLPVGPQRISKVDLSHNQLRGVYDDYSMRGETHSELYLEINRLSGQLPVAELEGVPIGHLSILRGNVFSCDTIPENDEFANDYGCGSSAMNESVLMFGIAACALCCTVLVVVLSKAAVSSGFMTAKETRSRRSISVSFERSLSTISRLHMYMTSADPTEGADAISLRRIAAFRAKLRMVAWLFVKLLLVVLVTEAPIYVIRFIDDNQSYSTHTHTYAWFWTLAYMRGVLPATLMLLAWCVVMTTLFYCVRMAYAIPVDKAIQSEDTNPSMKNDAATEEPAFKSLSIRFLVYVVNATLTAVVNGIYIFSTQQPLSAGLRFGFQLGLAVFRLGYAYCVVPLLPVSKDKPLANIVFIFRLTVVNNFIIPCVVTAFTSPSCFRVSKFAIVLVVFVLLKINLSMCFVHFIRAC
jgi:hypothetical protein